MPDLDTRALTCAIGGSKHGLYPAGELSQCPHCERQVCTDCWNLPDGDDGRCVECAEAMREQAEDRKEQMRNL